jgi:pimeloyl-ACP methyl ester carboxylesterase
LGNGNSSDWLSWALSTPAEAHRLVVDGVSLAYRAWGDVGPRGIVLVHGGKANGHWWDHIAPFLTRWGRVLSVDLSGHGDSDRRPGYSLELWADEVLAAAEHGGITGPPVLIGHSTGGFVVLSAAVS